MSIDKIFKYCLQLAGWLTVFAMSYYSGWRDIGFDRDNYIANYNAINYADNFFEKLFFAKDLMFLIVVYISNLLTNNPKLAFFISCSIALFSKFGAAKKMGIKFPIGFIVFYFIFLAPGLEFAAMRSAMAVGFLMLAIANRDKSVSFYIYSLLAVLSHMTVVVVVIMLMPKINKYISLNKINYVIFALIGFSLTGVIIDLYPHGDAYSGNSGTLNAYVLPVVTFLIATLLYNNSKKQILLHESIDISDYLKVAVFGLISLSFGFTVFLVTAATRYLEIAWFLMLISIFVAPKINYKNLTGITLVFIWFGSINIGRSTWLAIYDPSFL